MKVPTFGEVMEKHGSMRTALDNMVLFCEPSSDPEKKEFRERLQDVIDELKQPTVSVAQEK